MRCIERLKKMQNILFLLYLYNLIEVFILGSGRQVSVQGGLDTELFSVYVTSAAQNFPWHLPGNRCHVSLSH